MTKKTTTAPDPWGIQVFLNPPECEDKGWIKGTIKSYSYSGRPSIYLHVADCSRVITLEFGPDDDATWDQRIEKVERLRNAVNEFSREAIKALRTGKRRAGELNRDKKIGTVHPF